MQWSSANWNAILSSKLVCSLPLMGTLTANVCGGWFFLGQCLTSMIICFWTRRLACTTHGGSHKRIWPLLTHFFLFLSSLSLSMHCFLHTSGLLRKTIFFGHPYIFIFLFSYGQRSVTAPWSNAARERSHIHYSCIFSEQCVCSYTFSELSLNFAFICSLS